MKYAVVSVVVLIAVVAAGVVAYWLMKPRNERSGGFRDWVKNPDARQAAADYFAERESLEVPDDISDREIHQMVERLFVQEDEDFNVDRLELVGARAVPLLIEALEDPKTATTKFGEGGHPFAAKSPFERICRLLEPIGPAAAARPLAKYVELEDDHFRKQAALALGNIGTPECIEPMRKALSDEDDYVRSYAMMGIERGIEAGRCTKEFLDAMFPALTKLLNRDDSSVSGEAPELLLAIDPDRALPVLLSPEYFTVQNGQVQYIVRALNGAGRKIPHDTLLPFLDAVKPLIDKYPHDYEYAEALKAYAYNPDTSAEETFRAELASSNERVQEAAAEALAILSGVTDARGVVFDALENRGFDAFAPPQKHYYAVFIYDAEVNNGGHAQYFVNSSGDHWRDALEGLKAVGAKARAQILQEATALFGTKGPSDDNVARHRQLAGFSAQMEESLDELDSRYYACDENIDALLARYAIDHKEHFTAGQ